MFVREKILISSCTYIQYTLFLKEQQGDKNCFATVGQQYVLGFSQYYKHQTR